MSLDVETVLERRRLRQQVGLWRGLAIVAGVLVLLGFGAMRVYQGGVLKTDQIARITIEGLITDDRNQLEMLRRIAKSDEVRGLLVFVDSPGGTTTGGEGLFNALREVSEKKPVVAQFGTVAASAAYIAGLATDHIVARGNTITGSVGVIMQWPEVSGLLDKIGVKFNTVKSGKLKAEPNPFSPADPEAIAVTQEMIEDGQTWFVGLVESRRNLKAATIPGLLEGRIYSGRMALRHKLIDQIGAQDEAIKWMVETRDVPADLKVVDWKPKRDEDWPFGLSGAAIWRILTGNAQTTQNPFAYLGLDGLVSVWQPQEN